MLINKNNVNYKLGESTL